MMMRGFRVFFIITALLVLCMGFGNSSYGNDEREDQKTLQRIKRELLEKKKEIKRVNQKERSVLSDLEKIDRAIQSGRVEVVHQQNRLHEAEADLREVEQENARISHELNGLKKIYGQRLRALYKMSRAAAAPVFSMGNLNTALKWVTYFRMIAKRDSMIMREYDVALERLVARQTEVTEKKIDILARKQDIETSKASLEAKRRQKGVILANVRKEKGLYEQTLRELEESSASLWAMIKRVEQEKKAAKTAVPSVLPREGLSSSDRTMLPWPVDGQVLTRFGMQRHPQFGTMVFRRGIEIGASDGVVVHAVSNGQVVYADWQKGYGIIVILNHGNGFYTLYGNLSRLEVTKDARVVQGQAIGLVGDTGSLKGSKLYFEVRRNGEAQDPLAWLAKK